MSQEYQIPLGEHHPKSQEDLKIDIDNIYHNQIESTVNIKDEPEFVVCNASKMAYSIADTISTARNLELDSSFFHQSDNANNFIKAVAKKLFNREIVLKKIEPLTESILKKRESVIGATIFGEIAPNEHREFFNDDRNNWFFYQGFTNSEGVINSVTLHYEVHPSGILRVSSNLQTKNKIISGQELDNFMSATQIYQELVMTQIYNKQDNPSKKII